MRLIEGNEMVGKWLKEIQHPYKREVLIVELSDDSDDSELSALCSAFFKLYPQALFFSDHEPALHCDRVFSLCKTREYLGLTTSAVLFDARRGFALDYFLSIAATISRGGMLMILSQKNLGIFESQRFHEEAIATPYFHNYLKSLFSKWAYRLEEGKIFPPLKSEEIAFAAKPDVMIKAGAYHYEQLQIAQDFLAASEGIFTLFSKRGSGKSWLGAKLIADNPSHYILTAPNQNAIEQYREIEGLQFRAPDALFLTIEETDLQLETLIIEEAAKMPLSHLERLCRRFNKVLMISSVENYEGTGQGLREKIQDLVVITKGYQLQQSWRFLGNDPLKQLCDDLMLRSLQTGDCQNQRSSNLLHFSPATLFKEEIEYQFYNRQNMASLRSDLAQLSDLYQLLNDTHYQTNIQDLRRLFDAPSQIFVLAYYQKKLIGAIWAMEEGGLSPELTTTVFNGLRRPKGNLVAQMLAGQSYFPEAMLEKSIRISRISVVKPLRRLGIGQTMVHFLEEKVSAEIDFLSVSFGLTVNLLQFWESIGYQIAHLGFHLDKTTGLHSAVVLKGMGIQDQSQKRGELHWVEASFAKFKADAALNCQYKEYRPEIFQLLQEKAKAGIFDERDQSVINAFTHFKRAKHSVENALLREKLS
ncbi:GNAT family N-acetyltransferase [Ignatzschineria rhizosphaerae]|uniref:GNAT family N-acetyltransferase n=1 Tax=Ignatzschineria rhizosphaerae TaxID=2923279 RepID=A0ABY3WYU5_9GAMM|nr:GNAT family N-acetyltransferase [Ignatzschineria rhizosphaerae]UNM95788.1 GNAT family N-acetyltransferase [Ignatzschineria rhizosphaerae]